MANTGGGVVIIAQGRSAREFIRRLQQHPPPLATIASFAVARARLRRYDSFTIRPARNSQLVTRDSPIHVLPDLATCPDCRRELADPQDRRYGYPFINCTQCGPRYTIIETLPYDRPRTTMRRFRMCDRCRREYADPSDRRYHAQPIACPDCGPKVAIISTRNSQLVTRNSPVVAAARALLQGQIVAIKSLGGFQLACDATNTRAVARLRRRKDRPAKPLALMCESAAVAGRICRLGTKARKVLLSPAAPIVLLPKSAVPDIAVAASVAPGNARLGVMLCYTPLHAILFRRLRALAGKPAVLVMTSANRKDDPIAAADEELTKELGSVPDLVLTHDREIANRCDDSVVLVDEVEVKAKVEDSTSNSTLTSTCSLSILRRARGYAPRPVPLAGMFHVKHPTLAVGAEFKNAFALASGGRAFLSPHIGTVATARGKEFWLDTLVRYKEWTGIQPEVIACDLHPDYASTRLAEELSRRLELPLVRVQHHYAHILSVMAEHGLAGPTLGLAFDGTGHGTDGAVWGCEFLLVQNDLNWQRVGHLSYMRLTGAGDEVANPSRVAREYLRQASRMEGSGVLGFWGSGLNSRTRGPLNPPGLRTSSLGRLFDAVAAISGVCRTASFDGQAPVALEAVANPNERGHWFTRDLLDLSVSPALVRPEPLLLDVSRETSAGASPASISAKFHNTIALAVVSLADELCRRHRVTTVCLSGGSFQNSLLRCRIVAGLRGRRVCWNHLVPLNDGGIALGQVAAVRNGEFSASAERQT